jgi:hypothetical protein
VTVDAFERAKRELSRAHERDASLCTPFMDVLPVTGASVSVLVSGSTGQSTVCASDATAARLDELQFDLGEGPCWDALARHLPVLRPDLTGARTDWPAFGDALESDEQTSYVASVFAFHLSVGSLDIGAVDLYSTTHTALDSDQVTEAIGLASIASWQVLRRILGDRNDEQPAYSRREVHQATGMLIVQLDVSAEEAALLLRAHAFAQGRSVRDVANDVVGRRLDFSSDGRGDNAARR